MGRAGRLPVPARLSRMRRHPARLSCAPCRAPSANIKEAIRAYIAALEEDGLPVPEERFDAILVAV